MPHQGFLPYRLGRRLQRAVLVSLLLLPIWLLRPQPGSARPVCEAGRPVASQSLSQSLRGDEAAACTTEEHRASILQDCQLLAWYGNPLTPKLGIIGEYSLVDLLERPGGLEFGRPNLRQLAAEYDALNGRLCVVPALHLIFGTAWSGGAIGYLRSDLVLEYIDYAEANGLAVILDHQLGRYSIGEAIATMLLYLRYPNVHLAIDPEWHTLRPGLEIGSVAGEEVNAAQALMQAWLEEKGITGRKLLLVHQFHQEMIRGREVIRNDLPQVEVVHVADGFGSPAVKIGQYARNREAANLPRKGFKLFFETSYRRWGFDQPLMTPADVLGLDPVPAVIIYQ